MTVDRYLRMIAGALVVLYCYSTLAIGRALTGIYSPRLLDSTCFSRRLLTGVR